MTVQPGTLLTKRYRVVRLLGEGGMGYVVAAHDDELDRLVAVKLVRKDTLDSGAIDRLMREARAAAAIDSPHVARVLDFGRTKRGEPFLVLEHLEGVDLAHVGRSPSIDDVVGWVLQACVGLAAAHGRGIVHRDLKPSNLFLARQPDGTALIKLLDFGLAKSFERDDGRVTATGAIIGSPSYMSPEQLSGRALDARSDVWSLGVTLYELLTDQLPFPGPTTPAICTAVMTAEPLPPRSLRPDIPGELEDIILACLQKEPDHRPEDVAVLAQRLELVSPAHAGVAGRTRHVLATSTAPKVVVDPAFDPVMPTHLVSSVDTSQSERRHGAAWLLAASAVVLAGIVGVAVMVGRRPLAAPSSAPTPTTPESRSPTPSVMVATSESATPIASGAPVVSARPARSLPHPAPTSHPTPRRSADPLERF